jgi:tetratricopeptide (TPR) repeat protein
VAAGAAWQAWHEANGATELHAGRWDGTGPDAAKATAAYVWSRSADDGEADFAEVPEATTGQTASPAAGPEASLGTVRALLGEGQYLEAEAILDAVLREAEALKAEVARNLSSHARRLLARAQAALRAGQINVAVTLSHQAHDEDRTDPVVFEGMMKVHADAGSMLTRPEDYAEAIKLLECAHRHDQSDRAIHKALTERHYRHALAMHNLNNVNKALAAVKQALNYDYKHPGANQLLQQLSG